MQLPQLMRIKVILLLRSESVPNPISQNITNWIRRLHMREALGLENTRRDLYPEAAVARTEFHLSQILKQKRKNPDWADNLLRSARSTLEKLLPLNPLQGVAPEHELALFDHIQPIFDGRFTGTMLLQYVV